MSTDAVALARPLSDALHDALDACAALRARVADALERPRATRGALEMTPANLDFGRMKRGDGATLYARCARVDNASVDADYACVRATTTPSRAYFALAKAPGRGTHRAVAAARRRARSGDAATTTTATEAVTIRVEFDLEKCAEDGAHATWVVCVMAPERAAREAEARAKVEGAEKAADALAAECVVLATRVTVMVHTKSLVERVLDVEAAPFVPQRLRELFNSSEFSYPQHSAWKARRFGLRGMDPKREAHAVRAFRESGNAFGANELARWVRLLRLEQIAQQDSLEKLDMFNCRAKMVDKADKALHFGNLHDDDAMYAIEVPGLAENRPLVLAGDVIFIRPAANIALEYGVVVRHVSTRLSTIFIVLNAAYAGEGMNVHVRFTLNTEVFDLFHEAVLNTCAERTRATHLHRALPGGERRGAMTPSTRKAVKSKVLNDEQLRVVEDVVSGAGKQYPYIVWGPPGTGKTLTIVECVAHVLEMFPHARVLLAAPSAFAADILCSRLAKRLTPFKKKMIVRVNDVRRTPESVKADVRFHSLEIWRDDPEEAKQYASVPFHFFKRPDPLKHLKHARVVVCTCTSAALLRKLPMPVDSVVENWTPTHIFVDEAAQALVPETLIPLSLASSETSIVLAGDSKQLGPNVHSKEAAQAGLRKSLLEMWMDHSKEEVARGVWNGTQLRACYRSHPDIVALPSRMFYDGTVESCAPTANTDLPANWENFSRGAGNGRASRFLFYGVKGRQRREGNTSSWTNPIECAELVDLLEALLDSTNLTPADVAVMATYRRQVVLIRIALRARSLGAIRVGTVDDFQGQEEKIIFISTVVTRPTTLDALDSEIGFLNNPKRFNVAISRAMALNVIVGHPLVLLQNPLWAELVRECVRRDAFRGAGAEYLPRFAGGGHDFALPSSLDDDDVRPSRGASDAVADAVAAVAELALLGGGASDALSSQDGHAWDDWGDEPSWRVAV